MAKTIKTEVASKIRADTNGIRPATLSEYVGQERVKESLTIAISSAKARGSPLGHILLYAPPGLGKTTLANIIAAEMGSNIQTVVGSSIERSGDIAAALNHLNEGDILFIDEIHRMDVHAEELLYSAMEDCVINIPIGSGAQTKHVRLELPPFTLIGATTRTGLMTQPLRDRFAHIYTLDYYTEKELTYIIKETVSKLGMKIEPDACRILARASRGTPRIANRNVYISRDCALYRDSGVISEDDALHALSLEGINDDGLDKTDIKLLKVLKAAGKPMGLKTLALTCGEDEGTVETANEPFLLREGYIHKTPKGRVLTDKGRLVFGVI